MMGQATILSQVCFWGFSLLMIAAALGVVFSRSIVYSALMLLVTFLSIAGVFVMLNAPFIAAAQILVYAVGLTIVMIFGIMLTGDTPITDAKGHKQSAIFWVVPAILVLGFLGLMIWALFNPNIPTHTINGLFFSKIDPATSLSSLAGMQALQADSGTGMIGQMLFSTYLLPFELASILLLLATMGAIILSKRVFPEEEGYPPLPEAPIGEATMAAKTTSEPVEKPLLGVH